MKGAQNLACVCGGFFSQTYVRELLGKTERLYECPCGHARKLTIDGDALRLETSFKGVPIERIRINGSTKKVFRYPIDRGDRLADSIQKKSYAVGEDSKAVE